MFPSSKFWKFSESIKLIAWRHCVTHTAQSCSAMVSFALNITAQARNTLSWSTAHTAGAARRRWTQLHRNRELSETMVFVVQGVDWMRKEQDTAWILPGLEQTTGRSTEYLYCHKSYGTLFYLPKPHEISPGKKSFPIPGISLLSLLGYQKTIQALEEKHL